MDHTRARACARTVLIAANARPASAARMSTVREIRRIRGHRAIHPGLGAQHRDISQAVPTHGQRHRQVKNHLGRIVHRGRPAPRRQRGAQCPVDPRGPNRLDHRDPTGLRHHSGPGRVNLDTGIEPGSLLHLKGALDWCDVGLRQVTSSQLRGTFQLIDTTTRAITGESPGLASVPPWLPGETGRLMALTRRGATSIKAVRPSIAALTAVDCGARGLAPRWLLRAPPWLPGIPRRCAGRA